MRLFLRIRGRGSIYRLNGGVILRDEGNPKPVSMRQKFYELLRAAQVYSTLDEGNRTGRITRSLIYDGTRHL